MTVMLDTNVLLSAGLFPTSRLSGLVVRIAHEYQVVLSSRIVEELWRVVSLKFADRKPLLDTFLKRLSYEIAYSPEQIDEEIYPRIRDKKDYPILASAIIADVDVFVTGDKDFDGLDLERPEIMTVAEFEWQYLAPSGTTPDA